MEIFDIHHHLGSLTGEACKKNRAGRTGTTTTAFGSWRPTA